MGVWYVMTVSKIFLYVKFSLANSVLLITNNINSMFSLDIVHVCASLSTQAWASGLF